MGAKYMKLNADPMILKTIVYPWQIENTNIKAYPWVSRLT
jgi:hypothetical protein